MTALLSLGLFAFGVTTLPHEGFDRRSGWRHPATPRVGIRDAVQYAGPGDDGVTITGMALAELSDGAASLDELRRMAGTGEPWPLVDARGRVYGQFVITALDERHRHLLPDGTARRIDFTLDLLCVAAPGDPRPGEGAR